ncbi:MAG TPA: DUF4129 domain-containing protein [Salinimicrobium sp.]|nr:DUF4129 domain-containing protein [Salinimicrobium sp.]
MRILVLFLFLSTTCFGAPGTEQDSLASEKQEINYISGTPPAPLDFDEKKLDALKQKPAFDYHREQTESWWAKFKRYLHLKWNTFLDWLFGEYRTTQFVALILKSLPYLIIGGVVIFAVWLFNRLNPAEVLLNSEENAKFFLSDEEEIIQSRDIKKLIEKALSNQNFRLAIRYHYLFVLQQLTEKGIINYNFSKTDEDYLAEIDKDILQKQFGRLARIYDFVWYGNFETNQPDFEKAEREFSKMDHLMETKNG